jgi:hypothetical protein
MYYYIQKEGLMRTSSCALVNGKHTGVLVLEEDDFPISSDQVVKKAWESEAHVYEEHDEGYFVVRYPGSETNQEQDESALRTSIHWLNKKAVIGKANCGCVHGVEKITPCEHDLALLDDRYKEKPVHEP